MPLELIDVIRGIGSNWFDEDCKIILFSALHNTMVKVYNERYGYIWHPEKPNIKRKKVEEKDAKIIEQGQYNFTDGTLRVDPESFEVRCWGEIIEKGFIKKLNDKGFDTNKKAINFIFTSFNHILQQMIDDLTPYFTARKKQVADILNKSCIHMVYKGMTCWKLNEFKDKDMQPASRSELQFAARFLSPPPLQYPKNLDSKRGPSVSREKMKDYLLNVIQKAGGMLTRKDILELIKIQYHLTPVGRVFPSPALEAGSGQGISQEEQMSNLHYYMDEYDLGQDHYVLAKEMFDAMDEHMKNVYYHNHINGCTVEETAEKLACATGTITNTNKAINRLVGKHLFDSATQAELEGVIGLLSQLLMNEKESQ